MTESSELPPPNPWFAMWTRPRETIRSLVAEESARSVTVVAALGGIAESLTRMSGSTFAQGLSLPSMLFFAVLVGSVAGVTATWIVSVVLAWTGAWIGGRADAVETRAALGWSYVPMAWSLAFWLPALLLFGRDIVVLDDTQVEQAPGLAIAAAVFVLVVIVAWIWSIVLLLKGLSEVQGFSVWRAAGNVLMTFGVVVVPYSALTILAAIASS